MATTSANDGALVAHGIGRFTAAQFALRAALAQPSSLQAQKNQRDQQQKEKHAAIEKTRPPKGTVRKENRL